MIMPKGHVACGDIPFLGLPASQSLALRGWQVLCPKGKAFSLVVLSPGEQGLTGMPGTRGPPGPAGDPGKPGN
jgi:hypothetical protein